MQLSENEINKRLIRLRNLERLHPQARARIVFLEEENKQLRQRVKELEDQNKDRDGRIEALSFQFEQLKNKLFGKKPPAGHRLNKTPKKDRDTRSYQRPIPDQVTKHQKHPLEHCLHCQGELQGKTTKVFFEEDIPLPIPKIVIKHEVEVGYCPACRRRSAGISLPAKTAILGNNVKKYVCILSIANRLSHAQIKTHLADVFDLELSLGEIGNILQAEADNLRPEFESLKQSVLAQTGTHYDETGWRVQKEGQGNFAWVATGTDNHDTVFLLGRSRGKGNIDDIGKADIGITDDYPAYKNAFAEHQLCWAHPNRKLQDLADSQEFKEGKKEQIDGTSRQFSRLYERLRPLAKAEISPPQKKRFRRLFDRITGEHELDPLPLSKLKESLRKNKKAYFTFLDHPGLPLDNNKAERALRHLVIKRKISFGSKTQRGAETTGILASVILSLKWNDPGSWFKQYLALG